MPAAPLHLLPDDGDIDEVAVAVTILGRRRVPLTRPERVEVVRQMLSKGRTIKDIGAVLGMSGSTAQRFAVLVRDERARALRFDGRCDHGECFVAAQWTVTYPDGATRDYCTSHAVTALARLGEVQIPARRAAARRRPTSTEDTP